jgi:hypothetical protein
MGRGDLGSDSPAQALGVLRLLRTQSRLKAHEYTLPAQSGIVPVHDYEY